MKENKEISLHRISLLLIAQLGLVGLTVSEETTEEAPADDTTPVEVCKCLQKWEWDSTVHYGCTTTKEGESWCRVESTCGAQAGSDRGGPWISCEDNSSCHCEATWMYKDTTYQGCGAPEQSSSLVWCYVDPDCKNNPSALPPIGDKTREWKICGETPQTEPPPQECPCLPRWANNGTIHYGCTTTKEGESWCRVDNTCSTPTGTDRGGPWVSCKNTSSCHCETAWSYRGMEYQGCGVLEQNSNLMWCYVDSECKNTPAALPPMGEKTKEWKVCGESTPKQCECMEKWESGGVLHYGCSMTKEYPGHWCRVEEGCNGSKSTSRGGKWMSCSDGGNCLCQSSWDYRNKTYSGCAVTDQTDELAWCYTQTPCNNALPSNSLKTGPWKVCGENVNQTRPSPPEPSSSSSSSMPVGYVVLLVLTGIVGVMGIMMCIVRRRTVHQERHNINSFPVAGIDESLMVDGFTDAEELSEIRYDFEGDASLAPYDCNEDADLSKITWLRTFSQSVQKSVKI